MIYHIIIPLMTEADKLKQEIEDCAAKLGIAPSTLGEKIGQGGRFYARLSRGHRVWPETAEKARKRMSDLLAPSGCEVSHSPDSDSFQGAAE